MLQRYRINLLTWLWIISCSLPGNAQQEGKLIDYSLSRSIPFTIIKYGTKHGLPQNQVLDIIARKNGTLIISTANGIVEYNGKEFFQFIPVEKGYKKQLQTRLFRDERTNRLYGLELGGIFNALHPHFERFTDSLMGADLSGDYVVGVNPQGMLRKRKLDGKQFTNILQTSLGFTISLHADGNRYYISDTTKMVVVDEATRTEKLLIPEAVMRMRRNPYNGKLYAVGFYKPYVWEINGGRAKRIELGTFPKNFLFTDIAFTGPETFFVATSGGLLHVTPSGKKLYADNLPSRFLQSLYYNEAERCLFVGTAMDGLLRLQLKDCKGYYENPGVGDASFSSVIRTHKGEILTVGSRGFIYQLLGDKALLYYHSSQLLFCSITEIDGVLFIGSWGQGVVLMKDRKVIGNITGSQLPPNKNVHSVFCDSRGMIWVGTGGGLARGTSMATIRPFYPGQFNESIITFYERRDGSVCVGTSKHLLIFSPQGKLLTALDEHDGLIGKEIRAFYEDKEGKLWVGTYDGGVLCYFNNTLTSINRKSNCYLNVDAFTLAPDSKGNLLMSSNTGLWSIRESKLNDFYYNRIPYLVPFYYGEETGIANTEFNGGAQNNHLSLPGDVFYFPSILGIVQKVPGTISFRKLQPVFQSIHINDSLVPLGRTVFGRDTRTVHFGFYSPSYTDKFNVFYQYKLTGESLPDRWSKLQKERDVNFTMLPPGKYVFSIRAIDGFNDAHPKVIRYAFEIEPYFYETSWFRVFVLALIVVIVVSVNRYRYYLILQKKSKENKINNTILELKLKAIQSKMDPHFIFNALNNIIYLLNAEKYEAAEELLQDFSLLIRQFLEKSDNTFLSLGEELSIINLYLLIEQKRYNGQFSYDISYDPAIGELEIPTLLIQPIVENAVKHGISHAAEPCFLRIHAERIDNTIEIVIEDNGVGRERSAAINRNRRNHTSKGLQLVQEKISIMEQQYLMNIRFEITDLVENGQTGTRVRLIIPTR